MSIPFSVDSLGKSTPAWLCDLNSSLWNILEGAHFITEYLPGDSKLVVHTDRVDDEKLATITELLETALPQNIELYYDPFPLNYARAEYLEGTGTQYIIIPTPAAFGYDDITVETEHLCTIKNARAQEGRLHATASICAAWGVDDNSGYKPAAQGSHSGYGSRWLYGADIDPYADYVKYHIEWNGTILTATFNDTPAGSTVFINGMSDTLKNFGLFRATFNNGETPSSLHIYNGKKKYFKLAVNGEIARNMIPALDNTGTPCMFDLVTRTPFYNQGTGDFLYPSSEAAIVAVMTLDLDSKSYAQLTAHGVRRLYHVPQGCTLTVDEYAAQNGFKELVEPPMPLDGYWIPEWRETETQVILDWVETEPPMEVLENE